MFNFRQNAKQINSSLPVGQHSDLDRCDQCEQYHDADRMMYLGDEHFTYIAVCHHCHPPTEYYGDRSCVRHQHKMDEDCFGNWDCYTCSQQFYDIITAFNPRF